MNGGFVPQPAAPDTYLADLRAALRQKFSELNIADSQRFYGVRLQIRSAIADHMSKEFIRGLISQVYIGMGGEDDEENRPDLAQFQTELLNLPEWN